MHIACVHKQLICDRWIILLIVFFESTISEFTDHARERDLLDIPFLGLRLGNAILNSPLVMIFLSIRFFVDAICGSGGELDELPNPAHPPGAQERGAPGVEGGVVKSYLNRETATST